MDNSQNCQGQNLRHNQALGRRPGLRSAPVRVKGASRYAKTDWMKKTVSKQGTEIVNVAQAILDGTMDLIEGSRILHGLGHDICADDKDPDFLIFVVIDSDTDHLPIGDVRQLWSENALVEKDEEIRKIRAFYKDDVAQACSRLILRFGNA